MNKIFRAALWPFKKVLGFYFPKDVKHHLKVKITVGRLFLSVVAITMAVGVWFFGPAPQITAFEKKIYLQPGKNIAVDFSRPVDRRNAEFSISPDIEGAWHWEEPILGRKHLFTRAVFVPLVAYDPGTNYKVEIKNVTRVVGGSSRNFTLEFVADESPEVMDISAQGKAADIAPNAEITVKLDKDKDEATDFDFEVEPQVDLVSRYDSKEMAFKLRPKEPLASGTDYKVAVRKSSLAIDAESKEVVKRNASQVTSQKVLSVAPPEGISSYSPTGSNVLVGTPRIKVVFSEPMDSSSVETNFAVTPQVGGVFSWEDDSTLLYDFSSSLEYGTEYSFTIKAGALKKSGLVLEADAVGSFTTIGNATVKRFIPKNDAKGILVGSNIYIYFDQPVDHQSAQDHFRISWGIKGKFSWSGNTMIFNPYENLSTDKSYIVVIDPGVKSINGLDSKDQFKTTFYTERGITKLNIPVDYQDYSLSCEVASLKMALKYKGVWVSEGSLMRHVRYDPTPHIGRTWGNPSIAFVGNISGKQNTTGYGVYRKPIERAAKRYRSKSRSFSGASASQLARQLRRGNPVVIWGVYGNGYWDWWRTPSKKFIGAWYGEHARTVIGFMGPVSNPKKFIVNDPVDGRQYWSKNAFMRNWNAFGRSGVVVY